MGAIDLVVAIGRQHERGKRLDAAAEQAKDVQRGLVGPVQVLEHHDVRRPAPQGAPQRCGHRARRGALRDDGGQLAPDLVRDVHEGPERARGEQRVARAPQHPVAAGAVAERPHERRLADPGLTADERQPSATLRAHRRQVAVECLELRGALQQPAGARGQPIPHAHMLTAWG
jgi:hypothetical protein